MNQTPGPRELWHAFHPHRGPLILRIMSDPAGVEFFDVEILDKRAFYKALKMQDRNRAAEILVALPGEPARLRASLTEFKKPVTLPEH